MSLTNLLRLVRFSHSIFALPFALQGAWLARRGVPPVATLALIALCAVAARTSAMAFNRWLDRHLDARNPRTRTREIPRGLVHPGTALWLAGTGGACFVACAFALNRLSGLLALPVLLWLFFYSFTKRFTWTAHLVLGSALALAPLGAWIGVRGTIGPDALVPLCLGAAVLFWVAGFDVIYACQDADFDAREGLHSIPARFGLRNALRVSRACHAATVAFLCATAHLARLSWIYWLAIGAAALLLLWEHRLVSPSDLSRVDLAFFTANGWIAIGLFVGLVLDLSLLGGSGAAG